MTAVFLVDVLNHLFAPFMLEIDIDIGRLFALFRDESLEQEVDLGGVYFGDAEAITNHRVGGRTAPLAQYALGSCVFDDGVNGEKVFCITKLAGDIELAIKRVANVLGNAIRITPFRAFLRQILQCFVCVGIAFAVLVGIFGIFQLTERERAALEEAQRTIDSIRRAVKNTRHLLRRFQMPLRIGFEQASGRIDSDVLADAGDDVLQGTPFRDMIERVVHSNQRDRSPLGKRSQAREAAAVVAAVEHSRGKPDEARRGGGEAGEEDFKFIRSSPRKRGPRF